MDYSDHSGLHAPSGQVQDLSHPNFYYRYYLGKCMFRRTLTLKLSPAVAPGFYFLKIFNSKQLYSAPITVK